MPAAAPRTRAATLKISRAWYEKLSTDYDPASNITPLPRMIFEGGFAHAILGMTKAVLLLEGACEEGWWSKMSEWAETVGLKPGWQMLPNPENDKRSLNDHSGFLINEGGLLAHAENNREFYNKSFGVQGYISAQELVNYCIIPFWKKQDYFCLDKSPHMDMVSMGLGYGASGNDYQNRREAIKEGDDKMSEYVEKRMSKFKRKPGGAGIAPVPPPFVKPWRKDIKDLIDQYFEETDEIHDAFIALTQQAEAEEMDEDNMIASAVLAQVFNDPPLQPDAAGHR